MLTLAFDAKRFFSSSTGFGTYCRTLLNDLMFHYPNYSYVLFSAESRQALSNNPQDKSRAFEISRILRSSSVSVVHPPRFGGRIRRAFAVPRQLRKAKVSLYHGMTHQIPRSVRSVGIPKILTIHDLIFLRCPEFFVDEDIGQREQELREACEAAQKIVAVSEATKSDLMSLFGIQSSKIEVIYSACDKRYWRTVPKEEILRVRQKHGLPDRYLLYVGSMAARKDLLSIVKAIASLPDRDKVPLVVVGAETAHTDVVREYMRRYKMQKWVVFTKGVMTEDLPAVYQGAKIFLYTSLYEGFGMPILEAITSGVPVIVSNTSAMPEAGGPGARLVSPRAVDEIALAIQEISQDKKLRDQMVKYGAAHARRFSSEVVTRQMMELYLSEIEDTAHPENFQ